MSNRASNSLFWTMFVLWAITAGSAFYYHRVWADEARATNYYANQVKGYETGAIALPIAATMPEATSFSTTTANVPSAELNSLKSQVLGLQLQVSNLQAQITVKDADFAKAQATINSQASFIQLLQNRPNASAPVAVPKTKDQLTAQYQVNNPLPVCVPLKGETSVQKDDRCYVAIQSYYTALNAWVNAQLASQ